MEINTKNETGYKGGGGGTKGWTIPEKDLKALLAAVKSASEGNGDYPYVTVEDFCNSVGWTRKGEGGGSAAWTVNRRLKGADPRSKTKPGPNPIPMIARDRTLNDKEGTEVIEFRPFDWSSHGKKAKADK